MRFVPLSLSRSSASANNSVSLALVISIISYLHHAKYRNSTNNCITGRYTNHVDVTRDSVATDGSVLPMHRSVLEISCDFAPQHSSPNGGPASKPLARHTRHSSGNMEHSDIWQVFWTHDSRVNLHISTDYSKGKASEDWLRFCMDVQKDHRALGAHSKLSLPSPWQFKAPCTAIGGR